MYRKLEEFDIDPVYDEIAGGNHFNTITHNPVAGVIWMLAAAVAKAEEIGVPQCIVIVDQSGEIVGEIRMTGSKFLSRKSARAKALTAASIGAPSSEIPDHARSE